MIHSRYQNGSAVLAVVIILTLAIVGFLAYIFWQNTTNNNAQETEVTTTPEATHDASRATYRNESIGIEFTYPKEWIKVECDDTYIENPEDTVYFGTNEAGLGIVDGDTSHICGAGSDFPPQMVFTIVDDEYVSVEDGEEITIDGKTAKKSVKVSDQDSIQPGLEVTRYTVSLGGAKYAFFGYSRYPDYPGGERDNSEASQQEFVKVVEEHLQFI